MTADEMIAELKTRSEDPDDMLFTALIKVEMLNDAQSRVINMLDRDAIVELTKIQTPCNGRPYPLSLLSPDYYGSGFSVSLAKLNSNDIYMNSIDLSNIKMLEIDSLAPNEDNPYYFIWDAAIQPYVGSALPITTVYYLSAPTTLVAGGACSLGVKLHKIIVTMALSLFWCAANKLDRAEAAFNDATAQIDTINRKGV